LHTNLDQQKGLSYHSTLAFRFAKELVRTFFVGLQVVKESGSKERQTFSIKLVLTVQLGMRVLALQAFA